ncbi:MAG: muramoyltetrapeptide carboxypeptidase [Frateuria sp.]|uniref:muramoyltetrapeptide carboxypeptidase n=1 Tax=Frateuria sp. TaxID=2211372 RepID=UPI0018259353|nr:muramoyltetrapeptide carboxypeptidase [Frateuria sp.]NUO72654.1 muramoyltetrapeptide carboxypeptidase [Frateuria sp.]NUR23339.1 muramoyltetrapeptide carboxypeptidase [Frateuria sp.]
MPDARIRLIAPSGYAHDPAAMSRGLARLREAGCTVDGLEVLDRVQQRFAGSDAERAADINALAALDRLPDVALVTRGGYGAVRLLGQLDYGALRERLAGSKLALVGHSDFTALQLALYAKSGVRSFAGPLLADLGAEPAPAFTWEHFWDTLGSDASVAAWPGAGEAELDVQGTLWGGNLAVLCSLLGTPYFPAIEGGILFVEDLGEPPFRIERLFYQLQLSGVLARQRALVVGEFHACRPGPRDNGYDLDAAFAQLSRMAGVPVIYGLPHGHAARQLTLPFGGQARLRVSDGTARLECSGYPHLPLS